MVIYACICQMSIFLHNTNIIFLVGTIVLHTFAAIYAKMSVIFKKKPLKMDKIGSHFSFNEFYLSRRNLLF